MHHFKMTSSKSYLSKEESLSIKGLLILLIILAHNSLLCTRDGDSSDFYIWRNWLYTFHIQSFFILPFLYGDKKVLSWKLLCKTILHDGLKLLTPYMWITAICIIIRCIFIPNPINWDKIIIAFIIGSQWLVSQAIGFHFLWFLPTFFTATVIKRFFFSNDTRGKLLLTIIGLLVWIWDILGLPWGFLSYLPFNPIAAIKYSFVGMTVRIVLDKSTISAKRIVHTTFVIALFAISSILFLLIAPEPSKLPLVFTIFSLLMPFSFGLLLVVCCSGLGQFRWLHFFGKNSLQLYLFHVIVYNTLLHFLLPTQMNRLNLGTILFVLTVAICMLLAILLEHCTFLSKILFPR